MRKLVVALAVPLAAAGLSVRVAREARADEDAGASRVSMTCERVDGPGRVRCDVEARVGPGETISWGDVVLTKTPPFVGALRGRIGPHDATAHDPDVWRWALALVARGRGSGEVEGRVRLVVCKAGTCVPREAPVSGRVVVGE
ncbi:MAG TPA: hypothetical protein VGG39_05305 [Polyangiaceae bacterium]